VEFFYFNHPSEAALWAYTEEIGVDALQSAYLKLELGMATSEEQVVMAEFMKRLRDLIGDMSQ
jgi:hypothetical protein